MNEGEDKGTEINKRLIKIYCLNLISIICWKELERITYDSAIAPNSDYLRRDNYINVFGDDKKIKVNLILYISSY